MPAHGLIKAAVLLKLILARGRMLRAPRKKGFGPAHSLRSAANAEFPSPPRKI